MQMRRGEEKKVENISNRVILRSRGGWRDAEEVRKK